MNVSTTAPAAVEISILNTRSFRLQQLSRLTGMGMDHLGRGLGAEQKPTAKVLLSAMEQTLLHSVAENIGQIKANAAIREAALRDEMDMQAERLGVAQNRLDNAQARVRELQRQAAEAQERVHELETRSFWQRLRG